MPDRFLVLDANILIRAVLGKRVRGILEAHVNRAAFLVPESAIHEAETYLPSLVVRRGGDPQMALNLLRRVSAVLEVVEVELYGSFESKARERLVRRDEDDWPVLACAFAFGCPIWTEDSDFFGCGVATWTSDRVEMFLRE